MTDNHPRCGYHDVKLHRAYLIVTAGLEVHEMSTTDEAGLASRMSLCFGRQVDQYLDIPHDADWSRDQLKKISGGKSVDGIYLWRKFKEFKAYIVNVMNPEWNTIVPGGDPSNLPSGYDLDTALGDLRKKLWEAKEIQRIKDSVKRLEKRAKTAIEGDQGTGESQLQSPTQDTTKMQAKEYNHAWYPDEYLAFVAYGPPGQQGAVPMLAIQCSNGPKRTSDANPSAAKGTVSEFDSRVEQRRKAAEDSRHATKNGLLRELIVQGEREKALFAKAVEVDTRQQRFTMLQFMYNAELDPQKKEQWKNMIGSMLVEQTVNDSSASDMRQPVGSTVEVQSSDSGGSEHGSGSQKEAQEAPGAETFSSHNSDAEERHEEVAVASVKESGRPSRKRVPSRKASGQ
jgi:hypothetical protein